MNNQTFEIKYDISNGYYSIVDSATGLALDVEGGSLSNNAQILLWSQHDGCNQDWVIAPSGNEEYTIISRCSSKVLDATAANDLVTYESHGGSNQKWYLGKIAASRGRTIEDGVYQFVSKANINKVIDIAGGVYAGMRSGNIIIYDRRTEQIDNQLFKVKYNSDGYYEIINPTSGTAFDVSNGGVINETPVLAWRPHNGCNQDWIFEQDNEGYYTIISRCSSKVLDATAADDLIVFRSHGGDNQKWYLINKDYILSLED